MEVVPVLAVVCLLALGTVLYFTVLDRVLPQLKPRFSLACHTEEGEWVKQPKTGTATSAFAKSADAKSPSFTYSAVSCRHIRDDFNCVKYGLSLSEEDEAAWRWRWEPDQCRLPSLTAKEFLKVMAHRRIAFVGDMTVANQFDSLVCLLAQEEEPVVHTEAETPPSTAEGASAGKAVGSTDEQKAAGRKSVDETDGLNANAGGSSSMAAGTAASAAGHGAAGKLVGPSSRPPSHVRSSPWWDLWPSSRAKGKQGKKKKAGVAGGEDEEPVVVTPGDDDMEGGARKGKKAGTGGGERSVVVYPSYNVTVAFFHSRFLVEARADVEVNGTACQLTKAVAANQVQQEALPDAATVAAGGSSSGGGVVKGGGSGKAEAAAAASAAASSAVAAADATSIGNGSGGSPMPQDAGGTRFGRKAMVRQDGTTPSTTPIASSSTSLPQHSQSSNPRSSSSLETVVPDLSASTLVPTASEPSTKPRGSTNGTRASSTASKGGGAPAPLPNAVPEPGPPPEPAPDPVAAVCYPNHIDVARPDPLWAAEASTFDVLVLSSGRAWTEESVEREGLAIVEDGRREKGMSVEGLVGQWAFPRAMSAVAQWLENDTNFRGVAVFRTFSPSHGRRECAARTLLSSEEARDSQVTDAFQRYNRAMGDALSHTRHLLLNVSLMSAQRADAHPWMASPLRPKADCSHWCLPGVPDTWNRILAATLVDIFREKNRFQEPKPVR